MKMFEDKRVLNNMGGSVCSGESYGNDEACSSKAQQCKYEEFSFPTGKQILEHRDRAIAVRTLRSNAPVHRKRAEQSQQDQNESSNRRECACSQECDAGLITESRKVIHSGETHHLPPGMLLVRGR